MFLLHPCGLSDGYVTVIIVSVGDQSLLETTPESRSDHEYQPKQRCSNTY